MSNLQDVELQTKWIPAMAKSIANIVAGCDDRCFTNHIYEQFRDAGHHVEDGSALEHAVKGILLSGLAVCSEAVPTKKSRPNPINI